MVDHRRTPSQRAYQLPGWFFVLTVTLSIFAFGVVAWVFLADSLDPTRAVPEDTASPTVAAPEPEPSATEAPPPSPSTADQGERSGIDVVMLNASEQAGLARGVAEVAEKAGWTVSEIGNWIYPAAVNAVYYPEGHQPEAELLADDVGIESVRPARAGMSTDALTVLLLYSP